MWLSPKAEIDNNYDSRNYQRKLGKVYHQLLGDDSIIPEDQDIEYYKKLCKELKAELDKYQQEEKSKEVSYANVASKSSKLPIPIPVANIGNDNLKSTETFNDDVTDFENNDNDNQLDKDQETIAEEHFNDLINQVEKLLISKASLSKRLQKNYLSSILQLNLRRFLLKITSWNLVLLMIRNFYFLKLLKQKLMMNFILVKIF